MSIRSTVQINLVTLSFLAVLVFGQCGGQTFTDAETAGIDYQVQGEYAGELDVEGNQQAVGIQVIALGEKQFELVRYDGGLPGDGWQRGDSVQRIAGTRTGRTAEFSAQDTSYKIFDDTITVALQGKTLGKLKRVKRRSPTLGAKPPEGAYVLFDGKDINQFHDGSLVEGKDNEKYLGATNCWSKQKFGNHRLHIEFRTPFMPAGRGQYRGNSGVYVQSRYEVQVLDSFGLEGENNECGGIYKIAKPAVNMCLPPLAWQVYDIDFTAATYDADGNKTRSARITVRHNDVVIHDDIELPSGTPGRHPEGPGPESLFLQNHSNPVLFRNIWVANLD